MTISTTTTVNRYTGNAATTVFPYTFRILAATDLVVTKRLAGTFVDVVLSYPADYSVSGVGNVTGGSVTLNGYVPATGDLIVIRRVMSLTQGTSIRNNSSYFAETHENVFDRQTMVDQQHEEALGRALALPVSVDPSVVSPALPVPVASALIGWDSAGQHLVNTAGTAGPAGPAGPPVVATATARDALFPIPTANQRVRRMDTGYEERYDQPTGLWRPESKTRTAGPEISMKALGALGNGVQDDSPFATTALTGAIALAAAERVAGRDSVIDFDPGTYLFNSSADFTGCTMRFAPGAVIKRAATATVTLGRIVAGDYKILDNSAGGAGQYLLAAGLNQADTVNARWTGVKADGTDDSAAMNLLADLCWGKAGSATRYGLNNAKKNRVALLPPGTISLQSASWNISGTVGAIIRGAGRLATAVSVDTASMIGIAADAVAYLHLEDLIFSATQVQDVDHPLIDADFTGTYPAVNGFLRPQQWSIPNCYLNGNNKAAVGLSFGRLGPGGPPLGGSQIQGDTVHIPNCLFGGFTQAAIRLGTPTNGVGNVLDWHFVGGDWQGNLKYGIESYGGAYHVHGTGQQNQSGFPGDQGAHIPYQDGTNTPLGSRTGATHCGNYPQIDNLGCDFFMTQTSSRGSVRNVRSEGYCLTRGGGISVVDNCETWAGGIDAAAWAATSTNFVQGQLVKSLVPSVTLDGRAWACWTATPTPIATGGSEPAWASARDGFMQENVSVTSGSAVVNCNAPFRCVDKGTLPGIGGNEWGAIVVDPAGTHQKFFAKVLSHVQNVSVTLDANVPWTGSAIIRMGELVTDGSIQWMPYDFLALQGEFKAITSGMYNWGQVQAQVVPLQTVTATFSRRDWSYDTWAQVPPFTGGEIIPYPGWWAEHVGGGFHNISWPQTPRSLVDVTLQLRTYLLKASHKLFAPIMFPRGFGTTPTGDVGIWAADGAYTLKDTETDKTRNAVTIIGGAIAPDPVGFTYLTQTTQNPPANTAGKRFNINGGTSSGTGASGAIAFRTNPGGSAGASVNDNRDVFVVNPSGVVQSLFGYQKGAVVGNINISAAGNATPNPAGVEVYRYQINGAATINAPINAAEGLTLTLEIFNNTGGALTPTFNAVFLGTAPSIGAGKWQTRRFVYDNTLAKWKPTGTWSGDL